MYKRYESETLKGALMKAKQELGPDVVILSQREVRKSGLTGILGKKIWQVVACAQTTDEQPPAPRPAQERSPKNKVQQPIDYRVDEPALPFSEFSAPKPAAPAAPAPRRSQTSAASRPADSTPSLDHAAIRILIKKLDQLSEQVKAPPLPPGDEVILPGLLPAFYKRLVMQEIPKDLAIDLMNRLCERPSLDMNDEGRTLEILEEELAKEIRTAPLDDLLSPRNPRILFFVGPTGVGKTTTLAKVATLAARDEKKKIAFVTIDTIRVAAAEQLKTYADLIQADIEVVMSEEDFVASVVRHSDKDMILVDTPGKNPCSPASLSDFSGYLRRLAAAKIPSPAVLLALSASTKLADLQRYVACYRSLNPAGIVFTKIDETTTHGSILPVLAASELPVVFLGTGQDVPEDLEPANPRRMARRILGR